MDTSCANNIKELWQKLGNRLKVFILGKVHDETIADDILQEVFIKIHSNMDKLKDINRIDAWIYQITRNLIADHFRGIKKEYGILQSVTQDDTEENSPDDMMSETLEDMVKMMDELPPEYCEALCLTEFEGMNQKIYAESKGLSYSAAKSRIQRARKMLKDMLMKCCHYQFDKYGTAIDILPASCCCCADHHNQ